VGKGVVRVLAKVRVQTWSLSSRGRLSRCNSDMVRTSKRSLCSFQCHFSAKRLGAGTLGKTWLAVVATVVAQFRHRAVSGSEGELGAGVE
jgi:hypothetical protein